MRNNIHDYDEREERYRKPRQAKKTKQPIVKQSYESSADVQRWLKEQAVEEEGTTRFDPALLAGRRDRDWILSSLSHFYNQELITDVLHIAKSGKEATVFCCSAHPSTGRQLLAAKIYRPRMFRSLSNDAIYRNNRAQRDFEGRIIRGSGRHSVPSSTQRGRSKQVENWITYEFETQRLMYAAGARVPQPIAHIGNAVLMEYIGAESEPAPRLSEVTIARHKAQSLFDRLIQDIERCLAANRIHGDLSAYNILYWEGTAIIIDFAQAVDPNQSEEVYDLLERDVERVYRYFARYGVRANPQALAGEMWRRFLR